MEQSPVASSVLKALLARYTSNRRHSLCNRWSGVKSDKLTLCKVQLSDTMALGITDVQPASQIHQISRVVELGLICTAVLVPSATNASNSDDSVSLLVDGANTVVALVSNVNHVVRADSNRTRVGELRLAAISVFEAFVASAGKCSDSACKTEP